MNTQSVLITLIWFSMVLTGAQSLLYLPGVPPKVYEQGDAIPVTANALQSVDTLTPFDYYSLPFCTPSDGIHRQSENLGERLSGDVEETTPFSIRMLQEKHCEALCTATYTRDQLSVFAEKIREDYFVNLDVDNLPAAKKIVFFNSEQDMLVLEDELVHTGDMQAKEDLLADQDYQLELGFPLGRMDESSNVLLNNHWTFIISYNDQGHIVQFEVAESSVNHQVSADGTVSCGDESGFVIDGPSGFDKVNSMDATWSYSVNFIHSDIEWGQRWEPYLKIHNTTVHWFQLLNNIMLTIILSGFTAIVLTRALKRDIAFFNSKRSTAVTARDVEAQSLIQQKNDGMQTDGGWKALTGDIFRKPKYPLLLAILVGSGQQITLMALCSIILSAVGLANPAMHRSLTNSSIFFFAVFGWVNGYESARWYRYFEGEDSFRTHVIKTALYYPAFNFVVFLIVDLVIWADSGADATNAVPFGTFLMLMAMFSAMSCPMVYFGAYRGYGKAKPITVPCAVRQIPRLVPPKPWWMRKTVVMVFSAVLVFCTAFMEMTAIMSSVWGHHFYFAFGFLLICFTLTMVVSAEVAIIVVYARLVFEDYNWWWMSFAAPASSGIAMFLYSAWFFATQLPVVTAWTSVVMYFGYMLLVSTAVAMMTGCVGFTASFYFLRVIYAAIKSD